MPRYIFSFVAAECLPGRCGKGTAYFRENPINKGIAMDKMRALCFCCLVLCIFSPGISGVQIMGHDANIAASVDLNSAGNMPDADQEMLDNSPTSGPYTVLPGSLVKTTPGVGLRCGLRFPISQKVSLFRNDVAFDIGSSLGFTIGPHMETIKNIPSDTFGTDYKSYYFRLLVEGGGRMALSSVFSVRLGMGLGLGIGTTSQKFTVSNVTQPKASSTSLSGTWELSPALVLSLGKIGIEAGMRLTMFPSIAGEESAKELKWFSYYGGYVGVSF
jgi:hypothetical protein